MRTGYILMKKGGKMNRKIFSLIIMLSLLATIVVSAAKAEQPMRAIVVFDNTVNEKAEDQLLNKFGGVIHKNLDLINGKAVVLPNKAAAESLSKAAGVKYVEPDYVATINAKGQPAQSLPWGVDKIDADLVWPTSTGIGVKVAILDTGISLSHPDLKNNVKGGVNTINPAKSANDDNGHGSHVAGIVAASNNSIGVIGVGPSINLYAVKVLNAAGSGYYSDIIEGLQWSVQNGMKVVNMSFGASVGTQSLHDAIIAANSSGITLVAAAGNGGIASPVGYPAAYPEVIAVAATNVNNQVASFSSAGPEVDVAAPGVSVYSTYKGSSYATLNGTSMAAPHVTGSAAMLISTKGLTSPADIEARLEATADLLSGYSSNQQGAGLVDLDEAALAP